MGRLYKPLSERALALYGEGDVERDFTPADEADMLAAGHLAIVPRPYRVLVDNCTLGKQDEVLDLALPIEREAALVSGGILEPVEAKAKKAAAKK